MISSLCLDRKIQEIATSWTQSSEADGPPPSVASSAWTPIVRHSHCTMPLDALATILDATYFSTAEKCKVAAVCKGWRGLVMGSVELWAHISFAPFQNCINDEVLKAIVTETRCECLVTLDLNQCWKITANGLHHVLSLGRYAALETLDLSHCEYASDATLQIVMERCPRLKFLGLNGLQRITDHGVQAVVRRITSLKILEAEDSGLSDRVASLLEIGKFKMLLLDGFVREAV